MESADISIRKATADDAAVLAELGARTFRETFGPDNTQADMDAYLAGAFSEAIQSRELAEPGTIFLIAAVEGAPVGYAKLRLGAAPPCIAGTSPIEIVRFYSDRPWIGHGVGSALMHACLSHAVTRHCDVVWLDVWERNDHAIGFYERKGFSVVGEQEFVLGTDVQHDLLMARRLQAASEETSNR
ncbi:MAG TPA: GNAT family N-acetyltransferase [Coriobacteriia bacterium]|nr:GNAT family N-acetyltransferase [Coriobacteriia bacterium]